MGILFTWFLTVVASFGMEGANFFRVMKDIADTGYKVDMRRASELLGQINLEGAKLEISSMFIPFFNMFKAMKQTMDYNVMRSMTIAQFSSLNVLEEMTEEEKAEYAEKSTGLHAIQIFLNSKRQMQNVPSVTIRNGDSECTLYYEINKNNGIITVLKVDGDSSFLQDKDVSSIILEAAKTESQECFSNDSLTVEEDDTTDDFHSNTVLQELNELKENITSYKNFLEEQSQESQDDQEKIYRKK